MNYLKRYLPLTLITLIIASCAGPTRQNKTIDEDIFKQKPNILIAQIGDFGKAQYQKQGDQGLLDIAINKCVTNEDSKALTSIDHYPIVKTNYFDKFETSFKEKKARIFIDHTPITVKALHKTDSKNIHLAPYDLTFLQNKDKNKYQYALILEPIAYGITRPYYGFIPTGCPNGMAHFMVYFVDLSDNTLLAYFAFSPAKKVYPMKGYSGHSACEITNAAKLALQESLLETHAFLTTYY